MRVLFLLTGSEVGQCAEVLYFLAVMEGWLVTLSCLPMPVGGWWHPGVLC